MNKAAVTKKAETRAQTRQTVGVLLLDRRGWPLLQLRDGRGLYPHQWATVGGVVESGESIEAAARREFREETGYILGEITRAAQAHVRRDDGQLYEATLFVAQYDDDQPIWTLEGERIDFVDPASLDDLPCAPGQREMVRDALASIGERSV